MSHLQSNKMQIWPHFEFWGLPYPFTDWAKFGIQEMYGVVWCGLKEHITALAGKGSKLQILPDFKFLGSTYAHSFLFTNQGQI